MSRFASFVVITVALAFPPLLHAEGAEAPADHFARGETLLAQADLAGAAEAFAAAAKADPENERYRTEHMLLRRVMLIRAKLDQQDDPARWNRLADALRSYYYDHRVFAEALLIDQERFEKTPSPESAGRLAETQLELGRALDAIETIESVEDAPDHPRLQRLKAIALVRSGKTDEGRSLLPLCTEVDEKDAAAHLELARLYALLGAENAASSELTLALQWTPPSRLQLVRDLIRSHPDFTGVIASESFAAALQTESKVNESSCSGGSSCGSCPSRSTCSGDEA